MKIGYGIIIEGEVYNFMRKVELLLLEKFNLQKGIKQSPHISVKSPFSVNKIDLYEKYLEELCKKINAFEIELDKFNSFEEKVIFLNVVKNKNLNTLNQTIMSDLKDHIPNVSEKMIFHATLAYGDLDKRKFKEAYEYVHENFNPKFKFTCDKIGLFYELPADGGWVVIKEQSLLKNHND